MDKWGAANKLMAKMGNLSIHQFGTGPVIWRVKAYAMQECWWMSVGEATGDSLPETITQACLSAESTKPR